MNAGANLQVMAQFDMFEPKTRSGFDDRLSRWITPIAQSVAAFGERYPGRLIYRDQTSKPASHQPQFIALNPTTVRPLNKVPFAPHRESGLLAVVLTLDGMHVHARDFDNSLVLLLRGQKSDMCPQQGSDDVVEVIIYQSGLVVPARYCPHPGPAATDDIMTRCRRVLGLEGGIHGAVGYGGDQVTTGIPNTRHYLEEILSQLCDFFNNLAQND